jgi:CheY-like chemotaxis protein
MNILIVDDLTTNRKLLRAQLEAEGHDILEAGDGVEALAVLDRDVVEAVISDILMPNLDGFGLCLAVRKHERFGALPFVFYTSTYTSAADMQLGRNVGANCYLTKPAPVPALIAALRDASFQITRQAPADETIILRQYNGALLKKLEDKEAHLKQAVEKLERAHERIAEPNRLKGWMDEAAQTKDESPAASTPVNPRSRRLPRCPACLKIREGINFWQGGTQPPNTRTAILSHVFCAECDAKHTAKMDKFIANHSTTTP